MPRTARKDNLIFDADIHLSRYMRHRAGQSLEEIAAEDKVSVKSVEKSVGVVSAYREICTHQELDAALIGVVMSLSELHRKAIERGLTAKKRDEKTGKMVDDVEAQMGAVEKLTGLVDAVRRKGGGMNFNLGVGVMAGGQAPQVDATVSRVEVFEDRLRRLQKQREAGKQLPAGVIDADQIIESGDGESPNANG